MTDLHDIRAALVNKGVVCQKEEDLSRIVGLLFEDAGILAEPEVSLSAQDRIDFMIGDFGIELKVKGTVAGVLRQLKRYAKSDRVVHLVTVTTSAKIARGLPDIIGGKNHTAILMGAW